MQCAWPWFPLPNQPPNDYKSLHPGGTPLHPSPIHVERRTFLTTTLGASVLSSATAISAGGDQTPSASTRTPELYAWRHYLLRTGAQPRRLLDFLQNAAIPALNRLGVTPVGVFETVLGPASPGVFVLTPVASAETFAGLEDALEKDQAFMKAAEPYLNAGAGDPVYVRQELSLLRAFANVSRLELPAATATKGPRLFELRVYESPSERTHRMKVDMFVRMGEVDIFRRVGLTPVFFARTIVGARMPNLTYMLVHENMAARDKSWDTFRSDPAWKTLAATPGYADAEILSNITTWLLRPAACSQI
jgi:NIPSNAP